MVIEDIKCTNLELSKQLKEAGYKQKGLWWWFTDGINKTISQNTDYIKGIYGYGGKRDNKFVAPTVAELGERLPSIIKLNVIAGRTQIHYLYTTKHSDGWDCFYAMNNGQTRHCNEFADTEANARAQMWLYLKKEGLL